MTPELRAKTYDEDIHYFATARVEVLVNIIVTIIIFAMLVLPVVALNELGDISKGASPSEAIGILVIFTLRFGGAVYKMTNARRQDLFATSAAYYGVMVVFNSNFSAQTVYIASP